MEILFISKLQTTDVVIDGTFSEGSKQRYQRDKIVLFLVQFRGPGIVISKVGRARGKIKYSVTSLLKHKQKKPN